MTERGAVLEMPQQAERPRRRPRKRLLRAVRQTLIAGLLLIQLAILGGYWFLTDSDRICAWAESALSDALGGRVHIGHASISVFEGVRLEDVTISADGRDLPDSRLFSARELVIKADVNGLWRSKFEPSQLVRQTIRQVMVYGGHVYLCENVDRRQWNFERLTRREKPPVKKPIGRHEPPTFPEVLVRGGVVEYSRIIGGRYSTLGSMAIDGQLTPVRDVRSESGELLGSLYAFDLDSRPIGEPVGPRVRGLLDTSGPNVDASLDNFEFDRSIRLMLPTQVQQWWQAHELAGRVRIPRFRYNSSSKGKPAFEIVVELDDVRLAVLPDELMGAEYERQRVFRPGFHLGAPAPFELIGRTSLVAAVQQLEPVRLRNVSGRFVFTPEEVRLWVVCGKIENNRVRIDGVIKGYAPDGSSRSAVSRAPWRRNPGGGYSLNGPMHIRLVASDLRLPPAPRYLPSLPAEVRREHGKFCPSGRADAAVELRRDEPNGYVAMSMRLLAHDGAFQFEEFRYPLHNVHGIVEYGRDPARQADWVCIRDMRGYGKEGTVNERSEMCFRGWVSPLKRFSGIDIHVSGPSATMDASLRKALPEEARDVMAMFDHQPRPGEPESAGVPVWVRGSFDAHIQREEGTRKVKVDVDLSLADGAAEFKEFPLPLRNVTGDILVRPDHVSIRNLVSRQGESYLKVDGKVMFGPGQAAQPELNITARQVPVDSVLLEAMPAQQRQWVRDIDLGGTLDVDGRIFLDGLPTEKEKAQVDFDLDMLLSGGRLWPVGETYVVTDLMAGLRLSRSHLEMEWAHGKRGTSLVQGKGSFSWPKDRPRFSLDVTADRLATDEVTRSLVPAGAREWWDQMRPRGYADLAVHYSGGVGEDEDQELKSTSSLTVNIRPRGLHIKPIDVPYAMEATGGELSISRGPGSMVEDVQIKNVELKHGPATITLNGSGGSSTPWYSLASELVNGGLAWRLNPMEQRPWTLRIGAKDVVLDDELAAALPPDVAAFFKAINLQGKISLECPRLAYGTTELGAGLRDSRHTGSSTQLEIQSTVHIADGSMQTGLPLTGVNGKIDLSTRAVNGEFEALSGTISVPTLQVAHLPARDLMSTFKKAPGQDVYQFANIRARLAGGWLADGQVDLAMPSTGASRYALAFVLQDVDLYPLIAEKKQIRGRVSASFGLSGNWDDTESRIGAGNVEVQGDNLYTVPVVFGIFQIANLSLPISKPFTQATMRYSLRGNRVLMEPITLRSENLLVEGRGVLDFSKMRVDMAFLANNPKGPSLKWLIPFREELFQIRVSGKILDPKVAGRSLNTFGVMFDHVISGEPERGKSPEPQQQPKKKKK